MRAALALRRYFAVPVIASACAGSALRSMVEMRGATGSFVLCRGGKVLRIRSESSEACARKYEAISMMLSWLMHGTSRRVLWVGSSQELFRRRICGELLFVLLQNLAQRLEQRVLRPLDRPILFQAVNRTGLQRCRHPGEHLQAAASH